MADRVHYYGPRDRRKLHWIPIYQMMFDVVLCHDTRRARNTPEMIKWLNGPMKDEDPYIGLFANNGRRTALFLNRDELTHGLVAHEILHAAHYMLEYNNVEFGPECDHETPALIAEHLTQLVYEDLKIWKAKIGNRYSAP